MHPTLIGDKKIRIGVILSAGGSAFSEAVQISSDLPLEFYAVTDRNCEAEARCRELSIPVARIENSENSGFSHLAKMHFQECGVEVVLLHFSRLIGAELFESFVCCNVHPALLPAFPGLSAVKKAWSSGARFIGGTLHFVDASVDGGPIIAQTVTPVPIKAPLQWCERASFLQKTFLTLILFELMADQRLECENNKKMFLLDDLPRQPNSNPTLSNDAIARRFLALQSKMNFHIFP
jgi:phosphoribosylglycinamide formyltransferase-1